MIARRAALHYLVMIPVQLEYTAPSGCPTQAEFVAFVANRGGDFARPGPHVTARSLIVTLRREGNQHAGSLELRQGDMASDARQLRAPSCVEVAEALAVVAAIALRGVEEATAPPAVQPEPPTDPKPVAAVRASTPKPTPAPGVVTPAAPRETHLRSVGLWGNEQLPVTAGPLQVGRSLAATLSGGVVLGAIPGLVLPRYDVTWMRTNFITTPEHRSFLIGNVFGVRWSYLGGVTRRSGVFSTELNGLKMGPNACTSLSYDTDGFIALLCSSFTIGLMNLETKEASSSYRQSKMVGMGAASLELDARYNIGKYFHLSLDVGGELWFSKLSAERADGSELFHSRLFNANLQLGLGLHF